MPGERLPVEGQHPAARALESFVTAFKAKQFESAWSHISSRWHKHYGSVQAFAADAETEPLLIDRMTRLEQALAEKNALCVTETSASLRIGAGRVTRLLKQGDEWVIDELDARE